MLSTLFSTQPDKESTCGAGLLSLLRTQHKCCHIRGGSFKATKRIAVIMLDKLYLLPCRVCINGLSIEIIKQFAVIPGLQFGTSCNLSRLQDKLQACKYRDQNTEYKRWATASNDHTAKYKLNKHNDFIESAKEYRCEVFKIIAVSKAELNIKAYLFGHNLFPFICHLWVAPVVQVCHGGKNHYLLT